jgi:hypothetical protein
MNAVRETVLIVSPNQCQALAKRKLHSKQWNCFFKCITWANVMRKFWMRKGQSNYQLKFILEGKTSDLHTNVKIIFSVIFYRPYWKMYYFNFCCWFLMFSYVSMLSVFYRFLPFSLWKRWIEVSLYTKYLLFRVSNFHGFLILLLCNKPNVIMYVALYKIQT